MVIALLIEQDTNFKETKMKKVLMGCVLIFAAIYLMGAASLTTRIGSYHNLVVSAAGAESRLVSASADYNVGVPAPGTTALEPKDLLRKFGAGKNTYANAVELVCYATGTADNTVEMALYGILSP